jgi:predicted porin
MKSNKVILAFSTLMLGMGASTAVLAESSDLAQAAPTSDTAPATRPVKKRVAAAAAAPAKAPVTKTAPVMPQANSNPSDRAVIESLLARVKELEDQQNEMRQRTSSKFVKLEADTTTAVAAADASKKLSSLVASDGTLTIAGVTLYGTLDAGLTYQTHTAPPNNELTTGIVQSLVGKSSNHSYAGLQHSGLSATAIGLKGTEKLTDDLSAVFKVEMTFDPLTGTISDGPGSLVKQNGIALANQQSSGDSSRAGQPFNSAAYGGLSSKMLGTITFGRQKSITADQFGAYDPVPAQNFSPITYSGFAAGLGATGDLRRDNSVKYNYVYDNMFRINGFYTFGDGHDGVAVGYQGGVGFDYKGFSADVSYGQQNDAINFGSLSAAQVATSAPGTLSATVSDDSAYIITAKYKFDDFQIMGGYENITFKNPSHPLSIGYETVGGYVIGVVNNAAYNINRKQEVYWVGGRYQATPKLNLSAGWYHYEQNSYKGNGCSDSSAGSCSGQLDAYSFIAIYNLTKRFDVYGGAMYSAVANGLSNGYLNKNNVDPTVGMRFSF